MARVAEGQLAQVAGREVQLRRKEKAQERATEVAPAVHGSALAEMP